MDDVLTLKEQENKRKGQIGGGMMLLLMLILLLIPLFWYQNPPPGQEGIQVNLGIPDIGMGEDLNAPMAVAEEVQEETPEPVVEEVEEVAPPPPTETDPTPEPQQRDVVTTESPQDIAIKRQKEKDAADRKAQREADRRKREADAEAERVRKAEAAKAQREREARAAREAAAQATKNEVGGLFSSGSGGGTTNKPGDGGATNGDPNSTNIGKKSFGSGDVGGGLGSRGVTNSPTLVENSQASGKVVVSLCVDSNGRVIPSSVKVTQRGTTTTNSQLRSAAIRNAKQWGFSRGGTDRQCGTITYNFKVQ